MTSQIFSSTVQIWTNMHDKVLFQTSVGTDEATTSGQYANCALDYAMHILHVAEDDSRSLDSDYS